MGWNEGQKLVIMKKEDEVRRIITIKLAHILIDLERGVITSEQAVNSLESLLLFAANIDDSDSMGVLRGQIKRFSERT